MKSYNVPNYVRYKKSLAERKIENKPWKEYTREELIIKLMPYAEQISHSFSTADKASGVMSMLDIMQESFYGLIAAVDRIDWNIIVEGDEDEVLKQIKGFVKKRIKGSTRRHIDMNRGDIRIPEHKLNEIRRNNGEDKKMIKMFFNSIFLSIDDDDDKKTNYEFEDKSKQYNINILNKYILSLMKTHLNDKEYEVLRMSYGLDCDKLQAKEIAAILNITGVSDFVRISQIKREALDKLIENVDPDSIIDFLN
jgi:DNA-binding CsgD family transcriptional regulator|tara:strand:- start:7444 stop:8199 length:756 start_codon:yes stop_codon:yes gene_type:complete